MKIVEFRCCVCGKSFNKIFCTNCIDGNCGLRIRCPYCGAEKVVRIVNRVKLYSGLKFQKAK